MPTLKPAQRLASEAASKTHISRDAQTISDPRFLALGALSYGVVRKELPPFQGPGAESGAEVYRKGKSGLSVSEKLLITTGFTG